MRERERADRLLESHKNELPEPDRSWPSPVQRAVHCIHTHLLEPRLTVRWMKTRCHINGKCFSARFKRCTGYYPRDYIIHHRIEASKQLLAETKASITQIALAVGYASLSAYCHTFKAKEGMSPSEWRKQNSGRFSG